MSEENKQIKNGKDQEVHGACPRGGDHDPQIETYTDQDGDKRTIVYCTKCGNYL